MTTVEVLAVGPQVLIEDLGRPGRLALGVAASGAVDAVSLRAANRSVGNAESAAALEILLGGLALRADRTAVFAVTGAPCPVTVDDRPAAFGRAITVDSGATVRIGVPVAGLRSYLAVRGGVDVPATLGSRSTDTSSGLGPRPLRPGDQLPIGAVPQAPVATTDLPAITSAGVDLVADLGPRHDLLTEAAKRQLSQADWRVASATDRIGVRLDGGHLELTHTGELPSAPIIAGALQIPPSGQPIVFLNDHPTTGGYPIVACVRPADLAHLGQARPGQTVRITLRENTI